jgi:hypothetical protein
MKIDGRSWLVAFLRKSGALFNFSDTLSFFNQIYDIHTFGVGDLFQIGRWYMYKMRTTGT